VSVRPPPLPASPPRGRGRGETPAALRERGSSFADRVRFDAKGLVPVVAQDEAGGVLMLAWANREALVATFVTGRGTYWSRSRAELWRKGDTSGHVQEVSSIGVDCDGDTVLYRVRQTGPACHTGARSCFFTMQEIPWPMSAS
jgi:phosphoribosyl-AMP cyclohydrolase